ncbi:unnamed protein product [Schistosoma rodhaini]|uniref:CCHC-type domain-containing protein n=1 Tax=Schistosoma rodhaini TaxID=6188 RepID=A0AA85FP49_9TREM|nr:unnamed protein product [Schistosoma rodhaini]CAH8566548.1 unnamed protein product [Schistosoma rodhaini]
MERLDINSDFNAFEEYMERFEIWALTKEDDEDFNIVAHFPTFIGQEAYSLLKTLTYPDKPISLPYTTLKELLLNHVKCTSFECRERAKFHKMIRQNYQKVKDFILELQRQAAKCNFGDKLHVHLSDRLIAGINISGLEKELLKMPNCSFQDARTACINYEPVNELDIQSMKISNTLLSRHDEIQSQGRPNLRSFNRDFYSRENMKDDSTRDCQGSNRGESNFGKFLSCGKFHSRNSCAFRNAKCFNCGEAGHIQSVCNTMLHFAVSNAKMDVSNDQLSLSRSGITLYNSSDLNETQSHCETKIPNQPTDQISHVIVPNMVCHNDSHTSDEISYNSENKMLNESNHDQKPDSLLVDADFSNDPLFSNETLNQFEENISEKSNSDIISSVSGPHNQFISNDIPNECEKYVPNELNSSHISDVIVPDVGYSYEQCMLNRIPSQGYDESEGIAKFTEIIREAVCPEVKFTQVGNPNQVQDYPNEYEADECFLSDCFAGKSRLVESHVLITYINAYPFVYSNMNNKKNMYHNFYSSQSHMMEYLKLYISVYLQILTYSSRCVRFEKILQVGNVILAKTLRSKDPTLFRGGGYCWKVYDANSKYQWFHYTTDMLIVYNSRTQIIQSVHSIHHRTDVR